MTPRTVRAVSDGACSACDGTGTLCATCGELVDNCECDECAEVDCAHCDGGRLRPDEDEDEENKEP